MGAHKSCKTLQSDTKWLRKENYNMTISVKTLLFSLSVHFRNMAKTFVLSFLFYFTHLTVVSENERKKLYMLYLTFSLLGSVCVLVKVSPPLILISSASAGGMAQGKPLRHSSVCRS